MEDQEYMGSARNTLFTGKPIGLMHKVYICGPIKDPDEYLDTFEVIRNASEQDVIYIHINSEGGNLFTAIQFLRVLGETRGTVIASVEGMCMSAATIIFMAAKHHEITNHSVFMFHNYSNKVEGKGHELFDHIVHVREWGEKLLRDVYNHFLTEDEIKIILDGKDLYMTSLQVVGRLKKRTRALIKLNKEAAKKTQKVPKKARSILISHRHRVTV